MKKSYLIILLLITFTSIIGISFPQTSFSASSNTQVTLIVSDGTETPLPTPVTSTSSNDSVSVCENNIISNDIPDLFEIRTNKNTATLFFTPPIGQYTSFYIAFSRNPDFWEYGVEFNQTSANGVLKYTINLLEPNTKYYFKLRSGNGCTTGNWSNTMTAKTTSGNQTTTNYKSFIKSTIQKINTVIKKLTPSLNATSSPTSVPQSPFPTRAPVANPTYFAVLKFPDHSQKHKFCILWWCFNIPWLK